MSQPRLIAVVGCSGTQGSSVARAFAADPQWRVRGLTRDLQSNSAKSSLPSSIEWVEANLDDSNSLLAAFEGAYAVYGMTDGFDDEIADKREQETQQGINIAQAAEEAGAQYLVWSSLPDTRNTSHGRFTTLKHTYLKADVTAYIRRQVGVDNNTRWNIKPIFVLCGTYPTSSPSTTSPPPPARNSHLERLPTCSFVYCFAVLCSALDTCRTTQRTPPSFNPAATRATQSSSLCPPPRW